MPELPEVETIVRELAPRLEGHRIARARLAKSDVLRRVSKPRLLRILKGNTVEEVSRRAKHAVLRLRSGHRLVVQPRMTGSLIVHDRPLTKDESRYAVLICTLEDGRLFVYRDVRRRVSKPRLLRILKGNTVEEVSRRAKHAVLRLPSSTVLPLRMRSRR